MRGGKLNDILLLELYLNKVKDCISKNRFSMEPEDKRLLTSLGISYREAIQMIKGLTPQDYVSGPEPDHQNSDQMVYVFGYAVDECELYIKLTFREVDSLFIMSFHKAKYEMHYPYR